MMDMTEASDRMFRALFAVHVAHQMGQGYFELQHTVAEASKVFVEIQRHWAPVSLTDELDV